MPNCTGCAIQSDMLLGLWQPVAAAALMTQTRCSLSTLQSSRLVGLTSPGFQVRPPPKVAEMF